MGLAGLLGERNDTPQGLRTVPIDSLEPGPFQPRTAIAEGPLRELADSIREHGLLQPILVRAKPDRDDRYQIVGGERRWRAAQLVPLHEVPILLKTLSDRDALAVGLVENLQRQDLDAIEEAEGFRRLIEEFGLTQDALGQAVGKSRSHIANTLRLLGLDPQVRRMLQTGQLTAGHARALLTAPDPVSLAQHVVARGLNVRQTEALGAKHPPTPRPREVDADVAALERQLRTRLGLKVAVRPGERGGHIALYYDDLDQLDGLVRLLTAD